LMVYTWSHVLVTYLPSRWAVSTENSSHCCGFLNAFLGFDGWYALWRHNKNRKKVKNYSDRLPHGGFLFVRNSLNMAKLAR
jgi:hypothetical protein